MWVTHQLRRLFLPIYKLRISEFWDVMTSSPEMFTDVSEEYAVSSFWGEDGSNTFLRNVRISTRPHCITFKKTLIFTHHKWKLRIVMKCHVPLLSCARSHYCSRYTNKAICNVEQNKFHWSSHIEIPLKSISDVIMTSREEKYTNKYINK
jgi:hypothetical protein